MFQKNLAQIKGHLMIAGFFILGAISWFTAPTEKTEVAVPGISAPPSVDTFIPRGHVLVPIEIGNSDSLASLVGDLGGVVDLYLATTENRKGGVKVASKVKLLRAPLNPDQYAVLVKDDESQRLLGFQGPFIAVIQNPEERGMKVTDNPKPQRLRVEYQN